MPEIQPFAGVVYRGEAGGLERVLAPPYDVITPEQQAELYARDPRNIVHVVLNLVNARNASDRCTYRSPKRPGNG